MRIGITGSNGFIGWHLLQTLKWTLEKVEIIPFERSYFEEEEQLRQSVKKCDVLVHLAGVNRHDDHTYIYDQNVYIAHKLVKALEQTSSRPHIIFASSTQEERDNFYGKAKKEAREYFAAWAKRNDATYTGLIIPNVFGPFGQPFYNSVVATFCHLMNNNEKTEIHQDSVVHLIYVGDLVAFIVDCIQKERNNEALRVPHRVEWRVSEIRDKLVDFKSNYITNGIIPDLSRKEDLQLFNTFRSYMSHESIYPRKFDPKADDRGVFVELVKVGSKGQTSFSTTKPGITRGNHFHTRKMERFAVIKGKASIEMRKIGTNKKMVFELSGEYPSYVDMPVWYTHNIKNIGNEELITVFWINEPYDPEDPDTFFETV